MWPALLTVQHARAYTLVLKHTLSMVEALSNQLLLGVRHQVHWLRLPFSLALNPPSFLVLIGQATGHFNYTAGRIH